MPNAHNTFIFKIKNSDTDGIRGWLVLTRPRKVRLRTDFPGGHFYFWASHLLPYIIIYTIFYTKTAYIKKMHAVFVRCSEFSVWSQNLPNKAVTGLYGTISRWARIFLVIFFSRGNSILNRFAFGVIVCKHIHTVACLSLKLTEQARQRKYCRIGIVSIAW